MLLSSLYMAIKSESLSITSLDIWIVWFADVIYTWMSSTALLLLSDLSQCEEFVHTGQ